MEEKNVASRVISRFILLRKFSVCIHMGARCGCIDQNDSDLEKDPAPSTNFRTKY